MNTPVRSDTAGAGFNVAQIPPLQSPLAHCVLAVHGSPSMRLCGVGLGVAVEVAVWVAVTVAVGVGVAVAVGVAVTTTQLAPTQVPPGTTGPQSPVPQLVRIVSQKTPSAAPP